MKINIAIVFSVIYCTSRKISTKENEQTNIRMISYDPHQNGIS